MMYKLLKQFFNIYKNDKFLTVDYHQAHDNDYYLLDGKKSDFIDFEIPFFDNMDDGISLTIVEKDNQLIVSDLGDTQFNLIGSRSEKDLDNKHSFIYSRMKLYGIKQNNQGLYVILTPHDLKLDKYNNTDGAFKIANLVNFIEEVYCVHDLESKNADFS